MSSLMSSLGIHRLALNDRIQLVEEILDSLDSQRQLPPLNDAQRQELDRRLAKLEKGETQLSTWDDVEARVLARLMK